MQYLRPALWLSVLWCPACHRPETPSEISGPPKPIAASVVKAAARQLPVYEKVMGTVQPELQATVSAKVLGRLVEMRAVPGMTVKQNERLAKIETPQLEAALKRAEAELANAASEAKRFRALRDSASVSKREIDRVEADLDIAAAERDRIRAQLDDAVIEAPFTGRITHKFKDTGDLVQPGTPICRIEQPDRLRFEMRVAESLAGRFSLGDEFKVRIEAAGAELTGTVAEISPAANPGSRTFLVKLDLPTARGLLAGQFGRALVPRDTKTAVVVPPEALLDRGQLTFVAVVDSENIARLRIVRTGAERPEGVEILAGLQAGERIVSPLPSGFLNGAPVRPSS